MNDTISASLYAQMSTLSILAWASCCAAIAQEPPYRADRVAGWSAIDLPEETRALLLQNGFVVTGELPQVFSAYRLPSRSGREREALPSWITADLVLDAAAHLTTELVLSIERRQGPWMQEFAERLLAGAALVERGEALAELAEIALYLQTGCEPSSELARRAAAGLDREEPCTIRGLGTLPAAWLKPVSGRESADEGVRRAFRVRRLLQREMDLRSPAGRELAQAAREVLRRDDALQRLLRALQDPWHALLGRSEVADPLRFSGDRPEERVALLPAFESPCQRALDAAALAMQQPRPSGLWLLAHGPFASEFGRALLPALSALPPNAKGGESLHARYLELLALLQAPEPGAPRLCQSEAWHAKQAFAQLGAWAQMRHAFAAELPVKLIYGSSAYPVAPYIAPYPRLFEALAAWLRELAALQRVQSRIGVDLVAMQAEMRDACAALFEPKRLWDRPRAERARFERAMELLQFCAFTREELSQELSDTEFRTKLEHRTHAASSAEPEELPDAARRLLEDYVGGRVLWALGDLAATCDLLGRTSREQLRGAELAADDVRELRHLGPRIGTLHGYYANSWMSPRDDHPRLAPLAHDARAKRWTQVGVARPQQLYVIVPRAGIPTLHLGGVLSYREISTPNLLSDVEWRKRLIAPEAPRAPAFTRAFLR